MISATALFPEGMERSLHTLEVVRVIKMLNFTVNELRINCLLD